MKFYCFVLCAIFCLSDALHSEGELNEACCRHGGQYSKNAASDCDDADVPKDFDTEDEKDICKAIAVGCCQQYKHSDECSDGMVYATDKRCDVPKTEVGKTCCEECSLGRWVGESQGLEGCNNGEDDYFDPTAVLRRRAYSTCCQRAAEEAEKTTEPIPETTTKRIETTTEKRVETTTQKKEKCNKKSCEHVCNDEDGRVHCQCHEGYRLQSDKKSCKDINECAEAIDDLCIAEDTVCHNTAGSFKCVPIKKRDVGLTCPPGFKRNVQNQVCDDINECQLPRPPCPKYLCENTIGGYKCAGKAGKPFEEAAPGITTEPPAATPTAPKNDICPPGFRAGPDDECVDIDECEERLDDCQRLSQHCINTHSGFFCQDHVSKRCAPGFKVNSRTGICEDIDECEESSEVCKRSEICVNLPGAYNCKSKISTLPKLGSTRICQEGTRLKPGSTICEDIDECREGNHLCDQFQYCINTYGGHECRCKNGFELDSTSGSCVDIDECALKLDNCGAGSHCLNVLGSFTCTRRPPTTTSTTAHPIDDFYYDSDEEFPTSDDPIPKSSSTTKPIPRVTPSIPPYGNYPTYPSTTRTSTTRRTSYINRPGRPAIYTTLPPTTTELTTTPKVTQTTPKADVIRPSYVPHPPELPPRPDERPRRPEYRPTRPTESSRRPYYTPSPVTTTESPRTFETLTEVSVTPSGYPELLETDKNPDGSYGLNTSDVPKNTWTNVVGRDKPEEPDFDINNLHCLYGLERDAQGNCVDINECETNRHVCSGLEMCVNMEGGYRCECVPGYYRDASGWCTPSRFPSTYRTPPPTTSTTARTTTSTTPRTTTSTTTSTTTERPTERSSIIPTTPRVWYTPPPRPRRPVIPPTSCGMGYTFSSAAGGCVDINECAVRNTCNENEECHNVEGGYYCKCGARCRAEKEKPTYEPARPPPSPSPSPQPHEPLPDPDSNVITVGAQYGQRGPRMMRPTFTRLPNSGAILTSCPWGYRLTPDKYCYDIDECAKNVSQCGPQQRCENFFGGYSCQCPAGHKLYGKDGCEDVDECRYGSPCSYNSKCVNTVGSFRCECGEGFRSSPTNDKVCVDIDECAEAPEVCQQNCANAWGGYRCYCKRGYVLDTDNRTCVDVNECAEWSASRVRGRACAGYCINEPGSYRCGCPHGYRLADDARTCIDIDECETGEASCAVSPEPGHVCQNTRGSYHCHRIKCPQGYRLEAQHRCSRIQRSCPVTDWNCLQQPSTYTYNFITFVANIYMPTGSVDLFTMHGPSWRNSVVSFELRMIDVQAEPGVKPADLRCFDMRPTNNVCVISLVCSLGGPQVAELELTMSLYQRGQFAGNAVARLIIIVSQYEF
ncbi:unnamed protein product [Diatraea saccharalis]|uniref:EGF-like domain-containing protein n=1 Tax=Diatraea saccharalis TaxID=40085 RepID=A0A9N9RGF8_9NEOP|nr:unnamed protein product [Diatraea saccharalis]